MSRTWKDAPYKVRQKRLMEKGVFDHDHELTRYNQDRDFFYKDEVSFNKAESKAIYAFRQKLIAEGKDFTEHEDPSKIGWQIIGGVYEHSLIKPKTIVFTISRTVHRKARYSEYCTDVEHFDVATGNDTRDGKTARCAPYAYYNGRRSGCGCFYCTLDNDKPAKVQRKANLNKVAKSFNNGSKIEELNDFDQ